MKALPGPRASAKRAYVYFAAAALTAVAIWRAPGEEPDIGVQPVARQRSAAPATPASHVSTLLLPQRALAGTARLDLFASHSWYVPPPPPPPQQEEPSQPVAPPLPYQLIGSYVHEGEPAVFFLSRDDRVFDVHIGDTLEDTYSVDAQANGQLQLTYLPLKMRQTLNLGGSQ